MHVVVVGFGRAKSSRRKLVDYPDLHAEGVERTVREINTYLVDSPTVGMPKRSKALGAVPALNIGSKPNDSGHLILSRQERDALPEGLRNKFARRLYGAQELIHGSQRWCLWLAEATPKELGKWKELQERLAKVRAHRLKSSNAQTRAAAATPALFWNNKQPRTKYLAVPEVSSESYRVAPMAYLSADDIATNQLYTIAEAPLWLFGLLQSAMFTIWTRTVGGRLKSDPRISPGSVYNTFPFPSLNTRQQQRIERCATAVLAARAQFPDESLADLYRPLSMPKGLVAAHDSLDKAVDSVYAPRSKLTQDNVRLTVLFDHYATLTGQLSTGRARSRKRSPTPRTAN